VTKKHFATLTPGLDPTQWQQTQVVKFYPIIETLTVVTMIFVTLRIRIHRKTFTPVTVASVTADVEKQNLARQAKLYNFFLHH